MRKVLVLLLTAFLPYSSFARENPTFFLRPFAFVYGMPLGNFSARGNSSFVPGRAQRGYGIEGSITRGWDNGWAVGLGYQVITYRNDPATTSKWIYNNYHKEDHYTEVINFHDRYSITCLSASLSKEFDMKAFTLAPTLNIGLGIFGEVKEINVHQKKVNDNYWQDYRVFSQNPAGHGGRPFLYPRIGFSAAKKVYWFCYLRANISYGIGSVNYVTTERMNDFLGGWSRKDIAYKHPISNMSASIGIEVKIKKHLSEEEKRKYNMTKPGQARKQFKKRRYKALNLLCYHEQHSTAYWHQHHPGFPGATGE